MTKDDWIKLAMPASISLLAVSIFTIPFVAKASGTMQIIGGPSYALPVRVTIVD